ncbi:glycosyltransferase family 2 protein [Gramella sp. GC03-9]|uniref:Glycosyltransferase family 2 protein n=1 Tax=Christiangramia oceanisediminis TaxID=2920386 RepID=A0A9X2KVK9_9FLAO|nr:glycosyltransferase family A protein [Gramella oceanisediminis]MCP9198299.1 glycosyltransferase family 2 protein [Gramella oceanisediminis]
MIYLIHQEGKIFDKVFREGKELSIKCDSLVEAFWELAQNYPEEILVWIEKRQFDKLNRTYFKELFAHHNIMVSFAIRTRYFSDDMGYVDQLPFINPKPNVKYPTWLMSTDVGGIFGKTAIKFRQLLRVQKSFGYLINSMAKIGQQNSLFCYSDPGLVNQENSEKLEFQASNAELFTFVGQHYKKEWLWVLSHCLKKYEKEISFRNLIAGLSVKSLFQKNIDLDEVELKDKLEIDQEDLDVVIPSLGRAKHVHQVLKDLKEQTIPPTNVIIVEQNPDTSAETELYFINNDWPFKIIHKFIHQSGACNARNIALKEVSSKWVFLADDDIRLPADILERSVGELHRLQVDALNLACLQPGEEVVFRNIKQWGAFGSGTSIVRSSLARQCAFDEVLEFGFGEDLDFGLQLRDKGCDIIFHPGLRFTHLKAERGGFRSTGINEWETKDVEPKPSPTMMYLIKKHYTPEMIRGYKASLFLKFYRKQSVRNPIKYYRFMQERWTRSEDLCDGLQKKDISG